MGAGKGTLVVASEKVQRRPAAAAAVGGIWRRRRRGDGEKGEGGFGEEEVEGLVHGRRWCKGGFEREGGG